jgi:predicted MFS family arabinose efflux permease
MSAQSQSPSNTGISSYIQLVRQNRNFRFLWFGQIISLLGDWFNLIAAAALIASMTESGFAVGGLFIVRFLAPFVVSPVAGVFADRYNRKHLLIAADLGRAVVVMGFLMVRKPEHVWLLYTLSALQMGLSGFFFPARNAILPDVVDRKDLGTANALSSATWSVMLGVGAALGGLAAGQFGAYPAFVLDAATFVVSALLLVPIIYEPSATMKEQSRSVGAALGQYVEGLHYLREHADILAIALHKGAFALIISGGYQVVQVGITEDVFVIGEGGGTSLGIMYAVVGIGTGIGPIAARYITGDRDRPQRIAILLSYLITALGMALIAPLVSFEVTLIGIILRGIGGGIGWVFATQLLLQQLPDEVRGRVFATEYAIFTLLNAVGATLGGLALDQDVGYSTIIWWMAGLILIPALLWAMWISTRDQKRKLAEGD